MVKVEVTNRVNKIEYAIRDVDILAKRLTKELAKKQKRIFHLNIGDPVAFGFHTPQHIKKALCRAVEEQENYYSPSEGLALLRQAIAEKERKINGVDVSADSILITSGVSEGIQMLLGAFLEEGEEILLPGPAYSPYVSYSKFYGGTPIMYETVEDNRWQPNIDDLREKISKKTRGIVVINPNNPCGALYEEKVLKQILDLAGEHSLPVLSDEIYDQITYDKRFVSLAHLAKDIPVIGLNGFSKTHMMTGWRLGYLYFCDDGEQLQQLKESVEKECRIRICANTPVQKAGVAALNGPQDHVQDLVEKLKVRRDYAHQRLNQIEGLSSTEPEGAFYIFPKVQAVGSTWKTDKEFTFELLRETGVLVVHGSGFDPIFGGGHFRAVFLPPIETLEQAFNEIERFMEKRK